jgi:predicted Zn-dependent protease
LGAYLDKFPKDKTARLLMAQMMVSENNLSGAKQHLETLLAQDNQMLTAWVMYLRVLIGLEKYIDADRALATAQNLFPLHPEIQYCRGVLSEATQRPELAKQAYTQALMLDSNPAVYHYRLAMTLIKLNELKAACHELQQLLLSDPDHSGALRALGFIQIQLKQPELALDTFQLALKPDLLINYANVLQKTNHPDQSKQILQLLGILYPDHAEVQYQLGCLYWELKQTTEATKALNQFLKLSMKPGAAQGPQLSSLQPNEPPAVDRIKKAQDMLQLLLNPGSTHAAH